MVCKENLMALAQQPGMTACCLILPLFLSYPPSVPGTLHTVLVVTKGANRPYTWELDWQVLPSFSDHPAPPHVCPSQSQYTLYPSLGVSEPQAQPTHPLKILAAPPASILAGGFSVAFLVLYSLPCAATKRLFLKGKADLVHALPKFYCTR